MHSGVPSLWFKWCNWGKSDPKFLPVEHLKTNWEKELNRTVSKPELLHLTIVFSLRLKKIIMLCFATTNPEQLRQKQNFDKISIPLFAGSEKILFHCMQVPVVWYPWQPVWQGLQRDLTIRVPSNPPRIVLGHQPGEGKVQISEQLKQCILKSKKERRGSLDRERKLNWRGAER